MVIQYMAKPTMYLWIAATQYLPDNNWSYHWYLWRKVLPRIRFGVPLASTLVQKTIFFYKISESNQSRYLSNIIPQQNFAFNAKNADKVPLFKIKHNVFKNLFFLQLLLNGTSWILIFGKKIVFTFFLKKIFCNS